MDHTTSSPGAGPRLQAAGRFLFLALVFALSYTQAPLYYSNQNQYFLHGAAAAGQGHLADDWLANTRDPTPVFSGVVAVTLSYLHEYLFYGFYVLQFGIYFYSLIGISNFLAGPGAPWQMRWCFVTLTLFAHSALFRWSSGQLFGVDYPWYLQCGLAGQYLLGPTFQPSTFGTLLVFSIYLFVTGRPWCAMAASSLGAVVHTTYLWSAALLTLSYMYVLWKEKRRKDALLLGGASLLLVLPVVVYNALTFAPTSAVDFTFAQSILVDFRIPHHAVPSQWFGPMAATQAAWMVIGILLVRTVRLFPLLALPFVLSLALTLVQVATGNDTLALLFPWRTSAILVPICTTIIFTRVLCAIIPWVVARRPVWDGWWMGATGLASGATVAAGVTIAWFNPNYYPNEKEQALLNYVRAHAARGDRYLVPVRLPNFRLIQGTPRATDFQPTSGPRGSERAISHDLQRFRLHGKAPIFVDFKSIPYKDVEVLEWQHRLNQAQEWYKQMNAPDSGKLCLELAQYGITHIVVAGKTELAWESLHKECDNGDFRVYRLEPPTSLACARP